VPLSPPGRVLAGVLAFRKFMAVLWLW
jgi:hypothetical protein